MPFPFPLAFLLHPSPCPSLPIPSYVPHPDSPAGAGGSRQVEQHCPGPRCRWCWGQSSMGQGVKEHSTSPPWEHGNGSPAVPTISPEQSWGAPSRCREALEYPWGSSSLGTSRTHLADTGGAVVPIQAEPGSVCICASPEIALFWEKGKERGWRAKHGPSLTPSPAWGSSHAQTGGPGITWIAGAAVRWRGAGAGSWGAFRGEAGDIPSLWRGVCGWERGL